MYPRFTRNGDVELAYAVHAPEAPPNAEALLLIMGIQMRSAHWGEHFIRALAQHYRVVTFDNRGTGDSTKPIETLSARLWAEDALAVLDAAGIEKAHVLGFSMGGRIAQELVVEHPERVQKLILLASAVGGPDAVLPLPAASAALMPRSDVSAEQARREGLCAITGPGFGDRHPDRLDALVRIGAEKGTSPKVLQHQIAVLRDHQIEALPNVSHPTRILHGDADPLVPFRNGELLHELMPQAEFTRLPDIGHLPHWECPQQLLDAVHAFLG